MKNSLEKFNFLWNKELNEEEYNAMLEKYPNLWESYSLQEELSKEI